MKKIKIYSALLIIVSILAGCQKGDMLTNPDQITNQDMLMGKVAPEDFISPDHFVDGITNPYFPINPGDTLYYELSAIEDGIPVFQNTTISITNDIMVISGINCMVVHDVVIEDGELAEDTYDWYAQDKFGNVWYFGEDTKKYNPDGTFSTEGSFKNGVDGAVAGIIMLANPEAHIGHHYKQEDYPGHAQDNARVISVDETVTVVYGTFTGCLKTEERSPLEPGLIEFKYYAPGIGQILATVDVGGTEHEELVDTNF